MSMKNQTLCILTIIIFSFSGVTQSAFQLKFADSALTLIHQDVRYDPAYFKIDYPNGDVPSNIGVCTDVVIRGFRKVGIDLQKEVHEDMKTNFEIYPKKWGLNKPDPNIDHRRVLNLMTYFSRFHINLPVTINPHDYIPGDIVCWDLGSSITHIGIVVNKISPSLKRYLIVHNIGAGQELGDCLFQYQIIGHYRIKE
jgi:uncharacterized protein